MSASNGSITMRPASTALRIDRSERITRRTVVVRRPASGRVRIGRAICHETAEVGSDGKQLDEVEKWFLERGIPHFIANYDVSTRVWTLVPVFGQM